MHQYLQGFCNYEKDNWVEMLNLAEFAYNNSVHHSTRMTPFRANYLYHVPMQFKPPTAPSNMRSEILVNATLWGMVVTHRSVQESLLESEAQQSKYAGGTDMTFEDRNKVGLLTRHHQTTRSSKKLDYKRTGPYMVSKIINKNAYKLDSLKTIRNHKVWHLS